MKLSKILLFVTVIGIAMSGGVHRIAQSRWNCPQAGRNTKLSLYFCLDNPLPAAGYLMVGIPSAAGFTPGSSAAAWALADSWDAPTTVENAGTCGFTNNVASCTFASALSAMTAYGLQFTGSATSAVGQFAPVTMQSRMNSATDAGPIMDTNWVFDQISVSAAPLAMTLTATKVVESPAKEFPGETAKVDFVWTFGSSTAATPFTPMSGTSFMVHLQLGTTTAVDRAASTDTAVQLYPKDYADWTWTATCTSVQFGQNSEDVEATPHPKLPADPTCTDTAGELTFVVPVLPTSTDWSAWSMKFQISVTMPSDRIGVSTTVDSWFSDLADEQVYAVAGQVGSFLAISKPTDTITAAGLVAFGANPNDATQQGQGVGVYSSVFCFCTATATGAIDWSANTISNCGVTSATSVDTLAANGKTALVQNSIEIEWTIPYAIPDDRTEVNVVCEVDNIVAPTTVPTRWNNDPMKIFSSSLITNGMGAGNCFYNGVLNTDAAVGKHEFRCVNIGAVAAGGKLALGWQFSLNNQAKTIDISALATNSVQWAVTGLTCTLKVHTWASDTTSTVEWASLAYTTKIDGNGQTSKFGEFSSFIGTKATASSTGAAAAANADSMKQSAVDQNVNVWIIMANEDKLGADTDAKRQFPWVEVADTSATQLDIRLYGSGLKSGPTLAVSVDDTIYDATASYKCVLGSRATCISIDTGITAQAVESGAPSGMVHFRLPNSGWGGTCCTGAACLGGGSDNSAASCDKLNAGTVYTVPFMQIPNGGALNPVHSLTKAAAAGTEQSITQVIITNVMDMPAYMTTFRGRGGLGSSAQKLVDIFFQIRSTASSAPSIQALLHYYVQLATANVVADGAAGLTLGYPLSTYAAIDTAQTNEGSNDGASVVNTGVKFHIAATSTPKQEYVAVFTLRMTPFWHSAGANQVQVVVQGARTGVECWVYSSQTGSGYCLLDANDALTFFASGDALYSDLMMFGGMGLLVCKVGTTAGATGGETIFVPATQSVHAAVAAQYLPGLGTEEDATAGSATFPINNLGGALLCATTSGAHRAMRYMFGTDKGMMNMLQVSTGDVNALDDIVQADNVLGASSNAAIPYWYATTTAGQYNNAGAANFDMDAVTGTEWIYGGTAIATKLTWRQEGAITYSHIKDAMVICTPVTGSALPADLVITGGTDGTGTACTAVFPYTYMDSTTRKHRQCRWCSATFSVNIVQLHIAAYNPPATPKRTISGISIWGVEGTTGDDSYYTADSIETTERLIPTAAVAGTCGANPAKILQSTNAQSVAFTFKTAVPLSSGQVVVWQETTSTGNVGWKIASIPSSSVTCTCAGHATWTQTQSDGFVRTSANRFTLTIPDLAATDSEVTCTAGDVVCTLNGWNAQAAPANDMTATCFACDANTGSSDCTKEESATAGNTGQGVVSYAVAATVTYSQDGTAGTTDLSIKDVAYVPNSKNARGRLSFKAKDTATIYGGQTTVAYVFGGQTFGTDARCQIWNEDTDMRGFPGMTMMSDRVTNCVIAGQTITLSFASNKADFYVGVVAMDAWLASDTNKVTGTQSNFGGSVRTTTSTADDQYQMVTATAYGANKSKMKGVYSNTPTVGEIEVTRSLTNVMDLGMIQYKITVKGTYSLDGDSYVMLTFPTYYNPGVGNMGMPRCVWRDAENAADAETVFCCSCWDWQLLVAGPKTAVATAGIAYLRVFGVAMNAFSTAGTFGVGIKNQTSMGNLQVNEWAEATDGTSGAWGGVLPIDVTNMVVQNSAMRSSTSITIDFTLPATTGTVTEGADFVALQLPWGVPTWQDGSAAPGVTLELVETAADGTVTKTAAAGALEMVTGCDFVYKLATDATKMAETKSYRLSVKSVPTQSDSAMAAKLNLQNVVLSVGLMASGGKGYSQAQGFGALAKAALPSGTQLLDFTAPGVMMNRGTYQEDAVCVKPGVAGQSFQGDFTFKTTSSQFKTVPAEAAGKMGGKSACATLGAASSVAATMHFSYWSVTGKGMSPLPALCIFVGREKTNVNVPSAVTCQAGGFSFPMVVTLDAVPFTDITVALKEDVDNTDAANPVDNSYGVTIDAASKAGLQFAVGAHEQVFSFECSATANATSLKYELTGTDEPNFKLSSAKATITVKPALEDSAQPDKTVTVAALTDSSSAGEVIVEGECPGMGASMMYWQPASADATAAADWASVQALWTAHQAKHATAEAADHQEWKEAQMCMVAVVAEGQKSTCSFESESRGAYNVTLYCRTIENWFYASAVTGVTAPDNGGKPVELTLTYSIAIDTTKDNAVVLNVCGAMAEYLQVPYNRVQDEFGGSFGKPSPMVAGKRMLQDSASVDSASAEASTSASVEASASASNSTNATVQTEWIVSLYVQPDPRAAAVDPDATVALLQADGALAAVNTITSKDYGAPKVAAAKIEEAPVAWDDQPKGASADKAITISGSMTAAGYVYCGTKKARLLQDSASAEASSAEASTSASASAEASSAEASASASGNDTKKADSKSEWKMARAKVTATDLKFSITLAGAEGASLDWMCMGTSMNPNMHSARYRTTEVSSQTSTNPKKSAPITSTSSASSDSALMTSLFAAIIMMVAVFFY